MRKSEELRDQLTKKNREKKLNETRIKSLNLLAERKAKEFEFKPASEPSIQTTGVEKSSSDFKEKIEQHQLQKREASSLSNKDFKANNEIELSCKISEQKSSSKPEKSSATKLEESNNERIIAAKGSKLTIEAKNSNSKSIKTTSDLKPKENFTYGQISFMKDLIDSELHKKLENVVENIGRRLGECEEKLHYFKGETIKEAQIQKPKTDSKFKFITDNINKITDFVNDRSDDIDTLENNIYEVKKRLDLFAEEKSHQQSSELSSEKFFQKNEGPFTHHNFFIRNFFPNPPDDLFGRCEYCRAKNHRIEECRIREKDKRVGAVTTECGICSLRNHSAQNCRRGKSNKRNREVSGHS